MTSLILTILAMGKEEVSLTFCNGSNCSEAGPIVATILHSVGAEGVSPPSHAWVGKPRLSMHRDWTEMASLFLASCKGTRGLTALLRKCESIAQSNR